MNSTAYLADHAGDEILRRGRAIRILLADWPGGLDRLRRMLTAMPGVEIIGAMHSGADARKAVGAMRPDLLIVNVDMPDGSGFDVASAARDVEIVFVARSRDWAADAFSCNAADYLLEPVAFDRLCAAVERARYNRLASQGLAADRSNADGGHRREGLWVKTVGGAVFVPIGTITRIEAQGEYVLLHTEQRTHMARLKMYDLEMRVDPHGLVRVHRSSFVQLTQIAAFKRDGNRIVEVELRCGTRLSVSARYSRLLRERLARTARL
ncbi:MAG: LytTR family DNA-binding domain-containing protein [Sphingomonas sp.]|uniref:LytR/AlgR family response regulator transcription factor n=1 Tax=Sphingomonas sp. TaxID=28214 RepID=UPI002275B9B7|nr:LytTR family DNA-binding domain-containing protein [Sphingomonas sp.]MCX8474495.1 LytTR family DNA-binding domain-containing protein [Sphingomonas sp.]